MSHLGSFRKGWENENIARYILSRISFIANPSTVSDDIGSDYFCTLFRVEKDNKNKYLIPKNFFAIQIKSNKRSFDVSGKIQYLSNLEIPYFVGVVNQKNLNLIIYSGEYIPFLFTYRTPEKLKINLCERDKINKPFLKLVDKAYVINFPKIDEIRADLDEETLQINVKKLCEICSFIQTNIASRVNREYIFHEYLTQQVHIRAGKDSANTFRENFFKRLAENFFNLLWIFDNRVDQFRIEEFNIYENLLLRLEKFYGSIPEYIMNPYKNLKEKINRSY